MQFKAIEKHDLLHFCGHTRKPKEAADETYAQVTIKSCMEIELNSNLVGNEVYYTNLQYY